MEKETNNKLLLIDGSALMHRAYHAMPELTDRQGRPTGAIYGFVRMLLRAIKDLQPSHLAVALDRKEPTFRKKMYIAYQAQRPKMDTQLSEQFPRIRELLQALEIPVYDKAGFEADDVLGTIAEIVSNIKQNKETHTIEDSLFDVIILTGDKDLMQLVNDRVQLALPIRGTSEIELVSPSVVQQKLGIPPSLVVDYKGLVGDPSDNYPGILGIGPKTAIKLLEEFGNFKGVYNAIAKNKKNELITENIKKKLIAGQEAGQLSLQLAKIKKDVEIKFNLHECRTIIKHPGKLARVLEQFGFSSLVKQMGLEKKVGEGMEQLKLV